jgi:mono/diheme cytochrome c family protein
MQRVLLCCAAVLLSTTTAAFAADTRERAPASLLALLTGTCADCHNEADPAGGVSFENTTAQALLTRPNLIEKALDAIDSQAMPPDEVEPLAAEVRAEATAALAALLRTATAASSTPPIPVSRLNRFQYNNTVRDLFQLSRDIFPLPEKLMTRHDDALPQSLALDGPHRLPDVVQVSCDALAPAAGLAGVRAFPKDLRASHGFDNQADQLTLSPLLLDGFLHLSVSILESPDFTAENVGIWQAFFASPADGVPHEEEVARRLAEFLPRAFRRPVSTDALDRYTHYTLGKLAEGNDFPTAMKKVAAAILSSPLFLCRAPAAEPIEAPFALAERLSYTLWASCPDPELLAVAEDGSLLEPAILQAQVARMLHDPRITRFLDSFPAQWMQLENILAATPDPGLSRAYSLDPDRPAGVQMVLEPLLLFEAAFVENRPLHELIAPSFSYRSDFLEAWYTTPLTPPPVDTEAIARQNERNDHARAALAAELAHLGEALRDLEAPVRDRLVEARRAGTATTLALPAAIASWDFDNGLTDSIGSLHFQGHGDYELASGQVRLKGGHLLSSPIPTDLGAKSLEVTCLLENLDQPGGGLMGIQGPQGLFDTIVLGERQPKHWISGSNLFDRTEDFPGSHEETVTGDWLHFVMVYEQDGTTRLFRNGVPYGGAFQKGSVTFPRDASRVLLGLRHLPPGGNRSLQVTIDSARLYNRSLSAEEVAAAASQAGFISAAEVLAAMTPEHRDRHEQLTAATAAKEAELAAVPANTDPGKAIASAQRAFDDHLRGLLRSTTFRRVASEDPRYGGIVTNAAVLTMTSGPTRTHPVARGVWVIEVLFNAPPPPPPNDVPPLADEGDDSHLTIRERFAAHRANPSCAGCHTQLDPLGFALENFDLTGRWRSHYANGREVDAAGTLFRQHAFQEAVGFKDALLEERRRFARGFTEHFLRFALARPLTPADRVAIEDILDATEADDYPLQGMLEAVLLSNRFRS